MDFKNYKNYETVPEIVKKNKHNILYLKDQTPEDLKPLIDENTKNINTNTIDIAANTVDIRTNTIDINTNTNDITTKQNKLIAGDNISIVGDTISATGGSVDNLNSSKVIDDKSSKPTEGINPLLKNIITNTTNIGGNTRTIIENAHNISVNTDSINTKQNTLIAGDNISIVGDTISATGGGTVDATFRSGEKVKNVDYLGTSNQSAIATNTNDIAKNTTDITTKQNTLTAGDNITIKNDVISASGGGSGEVWENIDFTLSSKEVGFTKNVSLFSKFSIVGEITFSDRPNQSYINFVVNVDEIVNDTEKFVIGSGDISVITYGTFKPSKNVLSFFAYDFKGFSSFGPLMEEATITVKGIRKNNKDIEKINKKVRKIVKGVNNDYKNKK